jgi:hypothetical protein
LPLTHLAEQNMSLPLLMATSRHASLRSQRYAQAPSRRSAHHGHRPPAAAADFDWQAFSAYLAKQASETNRAARRSPSGWLRSRSLPHVSLQLVRCDPSAAPPGKKGADMEWEVTKVALGPSEQQTEETNALGRQGRQPYAVTWNPT